MKNGIKRILLSPWLALATLALVISLRVADPSFIESVRLRYYDTLITNIQKVPSENVVIANIDEETIKQYGQWPFPRNITSHIIESLYQQGAGLVVWNTIMSEEDRFGYDRLLSETIQKYPVILSNAPLDKKEPKTYLANRIELPNKDNKLTCSNDYAGVSVIGEGIERWVVDYPSILTNVSLIESCGAGSGITNTFPEIDGVTRRLPMIISSEGILYPNLALETLRVAAGDPSFQVKVGDAGIQAVRIPKFQTITTDSIGRIWLTWNTTIPEFSISDIPTIDGKIVIVGLTASGLGNPVPTSVGAKYPHHLQASVIDTLTSGTNISIPDWATIVEVCITILLSIGAILLTRWKYGFIPIVIMVSSIHFCNFYIFSNYKFLLDSTIPILGIIFVYIHAYTVKFITELNAKLQIKKQFGTYLSPALVEKLQKNPELLVLGGETRELSIMFTDVRGFTTISEHYGKDVQGLTKIMNRYMTAMTAAIIRNNGTLDKYIGDAQMAFWNAPLDEPTHAKLAVKTALEMLKSLEEFNKEISSEGVPPFGMGLGINTADVVVGNMGSDQRFDYTCLGDGVNLASRLEGQSKPYGVKIILGTKTAEQVRDEYPVTELDCIAVKGKTEGVKIYTLAEEPEEHKYFLQSYYAGDWFSARVIIEHLAEQESELQHYYESMLERIKSGLPKNWDGVFRATSK